MIVIVNGPEGGGQQAVCARLEERLSGSRVLPLTSAEHAPDSLRPIVAELRRSGTETFVLPAMLARFVELRALRRALGAEDSVIYAFRLEPPRERLGESGRRQLDLLQTEGELGDVGLLVPPEASEPAEAAAAFIDDDIHEPIHIVAWDDAWPARFEAERALIAERLGSIAMAIEHTGSTAIVGIDAKPVIDMTLTVADLHDTGRYVGPLRELGYHFLDYPTNVDRYFFKKGRPRSHHLHVGTPACTEIRDQVVFRDMLLGHPQLRSRYAELKRRLRDAFGSDRARYSESKGAFVREVLALAAGGA